MKYRVLCLLVLFSLSSLSLAPLKACGQGTSPPLFSNTLFTISPGLVSVGYNQPFTVNLTNLLNDSYIWIFCLAQANITRIDAPVFLTLNASSSYNYTFISPNETAMDISRPINESTYQQPAYQIYFGAVNAAASSFQTSQVFLQMTSAQALQQLLYQIEAQNALLQSEFLQAQSKADNNNALVIAVVVSNIFWLCMMLFVVAKFFKKKDVVAEQHAAS